LGISHSRGEWTIKPNEAEETKRDKIRELVKKERWVKVFNLLEKEELSIAYLVLLFATVVYFIFPPVNLRAISPLSYI
jgi:hypothetical protein